MQVIIVIVWMCVCVWVVISCLLVQFNSQLWDKHWPTTKEFNKDQHSNGERGGGGGLKTIRKWSQKNEQQQCQWYG